jgi:hypothetical protein
MDEFMFIQFYIPLTLSAYLKRVMQSMKSAIDYLLACRLLASESQSDTSATIQQAQAELLLA